MATKENLWEKIWKDPKYVRLNAHKDKVLHEWNVLDAYKNSPGADPEKLRKAHEASKRALKRMYKYEEEFFRKHSSGNLTGRNYAGKGSRIKVDQVTAPSAWASALVNGDYSGLEDEEIAALERWLNGLKGWSVVDVARDEDGEGQDPRFTWSYRLYGGTAEGGEVIDYVVHKVHRPRRRKS